MTLTFWDISKALWLLTGTATNGDKTIKFVIGTAHSLRIAASMRSTLEHFWTEHSSTHQLLPLAPMTDTGLHSNPTIVSKGIRRPRRPVKIRAAGSPAEVTLLQHWTGPLLHSPGMLEGLLFGTTESEINQICTSLEGGPYSSYCVGREGWAGDHEQDEQR